MTSLLILLSLASESRDQIVLEDKASPVSLQREQQIREFVRQVIQASGAHFRDESGRIPREEELIGPCIFQDVSNNRFTMVSFTSLVGILRRDGGVKYDAKTWPKLPEGVRPWTAEQCGEAARNTVAIFLPKDLRAYLSTSKIWGEQAYDVEIKVVPAIDPRPVIRRITMRVDSATGMPMNAEKSLRWPVIDPVRAKPLVSEEMCAAEAMRVYRSVAPFALADRASGEYRYAVPAPGLLSEFTEEHRALAARRESTVIYRWGIHEAGREGSVQIVDVDARTGKAIMWADPSGVLVGGGGPARTSFDDSAPWSLGSVSGRLAPVATKIAAASRHLLTGPDGTILRASLDPDRGLVEIAGRAYRPDAALLRAMRAEKPPVPFGKK